MNILHNRFVRTLLGGLLSLPYPGLGHILARRWTTGAILLAVAVVGSVVFSIVTNQTAPTPGAVMAIIALLAAGVLLALVTSIDAMRLLWRRNEDVRPPWMRSTWFALLVVLVIGVVANWLFPRQWRPFSTPSSGQAPSLQAGDRWMADLRPFTPRRGDVVTFMKPGESGTVWVKRIIGMPGDTVQMQQGRLLINGQMAQRAPIASFHIENATGKLVDVPTYRETLPDGAAYTIIEIDGDQGFFDTTAPYVTPPGHYFVMGDNRDNSSDSRLSLEKGGVGFIPAANVFGKAGTIFWSRDSARLFQQVQ